MFLKCWANKPSSLAAKQSSWYQKTLFNFIAISISPLVIRKDKYLYSKTWRNKLAWYEWSTICSHRDPYNLPIYFPMKCDIAIVNNKLYGFYQRILIKTCVMHTFRFTIVCRFTFLRTGNIFFVNTWKYLVNEKLDIFLYLTYYGECLYTDYWSPKYSCIFSFP